MAGEGFKIASAYVDIKAEDNTKTGIAAARRSIEAIPDKTVKVKVDAKVDTKRASAMGDRFGTLLGQSINASAKGALIGGLAGGLGSAVVGAALPALGSLALGFGVATAAMSGTQDALDEYSKALESGTRDFTEYNKLLAKMAPAQQEFTRQLVAMKKPLSDLQKSAAGSFLPGVTSMLKDSIGLFPVLDTAVKRTGTILSDTARDMGNLFKTDEFKKNLDGLLKGTEPVTRAMGDMFVRLTDRVIKFGAEMAPAAEGFGSFLDGMTTGLEGFFDGLAPHADSFKSIFESLGSIVQDVAPILGDFIGELSDAWAPVLRDVASWLRENKDSITDFGGAIAAATPWLVAGAVALKGLSVAMQVKGWVTGALGALKLLGGADIGGLGKTGGITWGKGFVGGLGLAGIGVGATMLLDEVIPKDAGRSYGAGFARDMLGEMSAVFKGQGSPIDNQQVAQWISNPVMMGVEAAKRGLQGLFGFATSNLPEIKFDVNTGPARDQVVGFMNSLKGQVGTVDINGRTEDAAQALAEIIQRINTGNGDVTISGQTMPASQALDGIVAQINEQGGTVDINGDPVPAGNALKMFLTAANASVGIVTIDGNTDPVTGKTTAAIQFANGSTGTVTLDGNPSLVNGKTVQAVRFADGSRGTITIDGNPDPATGRVNATVTYANGRTGRISVDANAASANNAIDWAARNRTSTITVRYTDPGGLVRTQNPNLPGSFGRATGGPIEGFASGGAVRGPGTGMSDSILARAGRSAIRLSNGEHIVTAREVQAAGGQGAVYGIRKAMLDGVFRGAGTRAAIDSTPTFTPRVATGERVVSTQTTNTFYVNIDASSVAEMQSVADFISKIQQTARRGPTKLAGVRT